jgi:hypothetical protein
VEELKLQVVAERSTESVDAIIATVACGDPFPHNALPTLQNPTHVIHMVVEDGIKKIQPHLEVVHKVKENVCKSNAVSKQVGISEDLGPSAVAPTPLHPSVNVLLNQMDVGSEVVEMIRSMSNNKTLKELLECSTQWAQLCSKKGEQSGDSLCTSLFLEDFLRMPKIEKGRRT